MWVVKLNGGNFLKFNNGSFEGVALDSGDVIASVTPTNYTANDTDDATTHLSAIDSALGTLDGRSLNSLSDVDFTAGNGIDGYVLKYNFADSQWEAQQDAGGNSFTSELVVDNSGTDTTIAQVGTEKRQTFLVKNGANNVTITLPESTDVGDGYEIVVKRAGTGTVTVTRAGDSDTIDEEVSISIPAQYSSATFLAEDGIGYWII